MSRSDNKKTDYSKKILKILGEKTAVSFSEINEKVTTDNDSQNPLYAITRSLKGLHKAGLVEHISSPQNQYTRLTREGKKKVHSLKLDSETTLVNTSWDGYWRIIILDLPENRKKEREALRYLLKKANFICIKNTVWISPHPYEYLFTNIKKDLSLSTELMIIVTNKLDPETQKIFLEKIKN